MIPHMKAKLIFIGIFFWKTQWPMTFCFWVFQIFFLMKIARASIWGSVYFCTMDGFFSILMTSQFVWNNSNTIFRWTRCSRRTARAVCRSRSALSSSVQFFLGTYGCITWCLTSTMLLRYSHSLEVHSNWNVKFSVKIQRVKSFGNVKGRVQTPIK